MRGRATVLAAVLSLATSHAIFSPKNNNQCDCSAVSSCTGCTTVTHTDPCYDKCQWCIPKLLCQDSSVGQDGCEKQDPTSKAVTVIGIHHSFQCQDDVSALGPSIMEATLSNAKDTIKLWDGSIQSPKWNMAPSIPVAGTNEYTLTVKGHNYGEKSTSKGQEILFCPWVNMSATQNPNGPDRDACFICGGTSGPADPMTTCGFADYQQQLCDIMTCNQIPAGIGHDMAVFVHVPGEPASIVAKHDAQPIPGGSLGPSATDYARYSYDAPQITTVSINGQACTGDKCTGGPGDTLAVEATNLPTSQAVVNTFELGHGPNSAIQLFIGEKPNQVECPAVWDEKDSGKVHCTIPMHAGDSQDITLSVGKQPTIASQKLDFPAPVISKVTGSISGKDTVPSWGDTITIEGKYLGAQSIGATVQLVLADQSTLPSCQVNSWTQLKINCTTAGFPDILKTTEVVNVVVTTASGSSNKEALSYEACDFLTKAGGLCKQDGSQECNTNYECSYSGSTKMIPNNGVCDHEGATCHCPESAADCKNGVFHAETCSCECTNGWSSSGAAQIPDAFVNGQAGIYGTSAGVCDTCSQSCGSLDKKVETPDKCGCEFNKLNLIWILLLVVLFLVAVGFGVWKYKKSQPDHIPLNKPLIKDEAQDDEEDPERTDSAAYM